MVWYFVKIVLGNKRDFYSFDVREWEFIDEYWYLE